LKIGRLIGVIFKEPFANPQTLDEPSTRTQAYRSWDFIDDDKFISSKSATWQYKALEMIDREFGWRRGVAYLCRDAYQEHGFFGYFARALREYICNDKETRKLVERAIKAGTMTGHKLPKAMTPETIVAGGGFALGVLLVERIPLLGIVGAPVIAGVVLILYTLGVKAFCEWSANLRTNDEERR
jgi:hypothetical protein